MNKLKILSSFSGAGGLDLGFVMSAGFEVVCANEVLKSHALTYAHNFNLKLKNCSGRCRAEAGYIIVSDVRNVGFRSLRGEIDVLTGGPPCQDFSVARAKNRVGARGRKGSLVYEYVRIAREVQPGIAVFENVPGLLTTNEGADWADFVAEMKKAGYSVVFADVLDFTGFGVPQMRKRLIAVFVRGDRLSIDIRPNKLLLDCPLAPIEVFEGRTLDELQNKYDEFIAKWRDRAETLDEPYRRIILNFLNSLSGDIIDDYIKSNPSCTHSELEQAVEMHKCVLKELGYLGKPVPKDREQPRCSERVIERIMRIPPGMNVNALAGTPYWTKGSISNYYRRLHPLKPSPTVLAYGGGGTHGYHYDADRCSLTHRERARIQTFPDWFEFYGAPSEVRSQIGEAVPPLASKRISELILSRELWAVS